MTTTTTREEFGELAQSRAVVSVCRKIFADFETPAAIYKKVSNSRHGSFLLESADQRGVWSRYSFVGAGSFGFLSEENGFASWEPTKDSPLTEEELLAENLQSLKPLDALEKIYQKWQSAPVAGQPPLTNGLVGFIAWEAVREVYGMPDLAVEDGVPKQFFSFVSELIVIDHHLGEVILVANVLSDKNNTMSVAAQDAAWTDSQSRLDSLQELLAAGQRVPLNLLSDKRSEEIKSVTPKADFLQMVAESKQFIESGDVSQVVVSQRFDLQCKATPLDVYRVLRHSNPSPFLYLLSAKDKLGNDLGVVGSSPEALVTITNGKVITHPIAGSRPRGASPMEDLELERELLADSKEVSEHKMLVELSKSDLAQICDPETIEVDGFMRVERFSHVMHIVSTVQGMLQENKTPIDAFRAAFPAGTLSGAPKKRAIEIIDALEREPRGVFGGVVGYFSFSGSADLAIAIRTAVIRDGVASVQAGAGIVADSVAESEYQETRNKAAAPLSAVATASSLEEIK